MRDDVFLTLQAECTMLFQSDPFMVESAEGLGVKLGKQIDVLFPVLDLLVRQGILELIGTEEAPLYRYNEPLIITEIDTTSERKVYDTE
ncbi:hypothetical protein ACFOGI_05035 [Virgibacillus xinjiangensis]|uniref:Uncharacterized protein n=1 Tax=Virgibacillus xinjiangensis TaxID=393090 RepID=A0ABV7CTM1_9BACI